MTDLEISRKRAAAPARAVSGLALFSRSMAAVIAFIAYAAVVPAAHAEDDDQPSNDFFDRLGSSVGDSLGGAKKMFGLGKAPPPPANESPSGCPAIDVLDGTGAQRITANAAAGNAGLRYQYSISDVARECQLSNNQMVLKVGVEGKVLLGPAGTPGRFDVPIRIAIVNRLDQKPFVSKLYKVGASIAAGQANTAYTLVADSLVIPFAAGRTAGDYAIKIGIDTGGRSEGDTGAKPSRRRKPVASAAQ